MRPQPDDERPMSELARAALSYATRWGLHVLPLLVARKEPHGLSVPHGYRDASSDPNTIADWWHRAPRANVGIACAPSGLVVIDVDPRNGGDETLGSLLRRVGALPATWTSLTPGGGVHYYLRHTTDERLHVLGPGLDIKYAGYVVAPPSIHPSGGRYRWDLGAHPLETDLADVPPEWLARMRCASTGVTPFASSGVDARLSFLGAAFEAIGWLGQLLTEGRRCVRCPWLDEHSDGRGDGGDSSTVLFSPALGTTLGGFHCSHAHCANRRVLDVMRELPPEAIDAAARAFPEAYRYVLCRLAAEEGGDHGE
jgi:hypothetical protein